MDREEGINHKSGNDDDDDDDLVVVDDDDLDRFATVVGLDNRRFELSCLPLFVDFFTAVVDGTDEVEDESEGAVVTSVEAEGGCEDVSIPAH